MFQLIKTLRKLQQDKKTMTISDVIKRYEPFAKLYPELFTKALNEEFTEEDYGKIMSMLALKHQISNNILSLDEADEKIKEKLWRRYI